MMRSERETVIRWDEEDRVVHVWSASPWVWRRMARLGVEPTRETTMDGQASGKFYRMPLKVFRWGLKRKGPAGARRNLPPQRRRSA